MDGDLRQRRNVCRRKGEKRVRDGQKVGSVGGWILGKGCKRVWFWKEKNTHEEKSKERRVKRTECVIDIRRSKKTNIPPKRKTSKRNRNPQTTNFDCPLPFPPPLISNFNFPHPWCARTFLRPQLRWLSTTTVHHLSSFHLICGKHWLVFFCYRIGRNTIVRARLCWLWHQYFIESPMPQVPWIDRIPPRYTLEDVPPHFTV